MKKILVIITIIAIFIVLAFVIDLSVYTHEVSNKERTSQYAIIRLPDNTIVRGDVTDFKVGVQHCRIELEKGATYLTDYANVVVIYE